MLNGDFLCNHLIIHQFSKRPQRGGVSILCWRAQQWERRRWGERKRASRWKWSKWIWASCLPQISAFSLVAALLAYVFNRRESSQFPSHFLAVTFTCHRLGSCLLDKMHPGFVSCTLCWGSLRERKYQLAHICIEPYGDWDSDWIGPPQTTIQHHPPPISSSCALLVYDKSVALIPGVGRER